MGRLVFYECRKHFLKKNMIRVLLLLLCLNIVKIAGVYGEKSLLSGRTSGGWRELYREQYDTFGGEITTGKIEALMEIYRPLALETADLTASTRMDHPGTLTGNVYGDYYFFRDCFVKPMEYAYLYEGNAKEIASLAQENMRFYEKHGNRYDYRKNEIIEGLYSGRRIGSLAYTERYQYYLQYDFSVLLVLLFCLYGLANVFVTEKETEMDALLLTAKAGGRKTAAAKLLASALFIAVACGLFWFVDFAAFAAFFGGPEGGSLPLYALKNFEYAQVNCSLLQYALVSAGVKTLGMLTLGMFFLAVSLRCKNALLPFVLNLAAAAGILFAANTCLGAGHMPEKVMNPFLLLVNYELFRKTEFVNCFGTPVLSWKPALLFAVLWIMLLVLLILFLSKRNGNVKRGGKFHADRPV